MIPLILNQYIFDKIIQSYKIEGIFILHGEVY